MPPKPEKELTYDELQMEIARLQARANELRDEEVKKLEAQADKLGYRLVPKEEKNKTRKTTSKGKATRETTEKWLKETIAKGPITKDDLQKAYRETQPGGRLRIDLWDDLLKQDAKGMVSLKP